MSLSEHEENIIVFVYLIEKQPNLFKEEERTNAAVASKASR